MERDALTHDSFLTGASTVAGYGAILVLLTLLLFGLPYLLFEFL